MTSPLPYLLRQWVHSREEDTATSRTYRPSGWPLSRSRAPRHVLEFRSDQTVVSRAGGPADSRLAREGRWDVEPGEPLLLRIRWPDPPPALVDVIDCSQDLLQLRIVSGSIE